jgi:hypothetical protein
MVEYHKSSAPSSHLTNFVVLGTFCAGHLPNTKA